MSDELKAARERLRQVNANVEDGENCWLSNVYDPRITGVKEHRSWHDDLRLVSNNDLAEHPADDDEPISEEWVSSQADAYHPALQQYAFGAELQHRDNIRVLYWPGEYEDYSGWFIEIGNSMAKINQQPATRGDMRRLMKALGIE